MPGRVALLSASGRMCSGGLRAEQLKAFVDVADLGFSCGVQAQGLLGLHSSVGRARRAGTRPWGGQVLGRQPVQEGLQSRVSPELAH